MPSLDTQTTVPITSLGPAQVSLPPACGLAWVLSQPDAFQGLLILLSSPIHLAEQKLSKLLIY